MASITFQSKDYRSALKELKQLSGKTIMVCGGKGLIGSSLIEYLLSANKKLGLSIHVIALARNLPKLRERFAQYVDDVNLDLAEADVVSLNKADFKDVSIDYIINAASPAHPVAYAKNPVEVMQANYMGTFNLLQLSLEKDARYLYVSSGEVYGQPIGQQDEAGFANSESDYGYMDILNPRACYPEGKRAAETLCISFNAEYGTKAVIARPSQVYGPNITEDNTRADAQFLRKCIDGEDIVMKSSGDQLRSMCYVKDAVTAILFIILYGESGQAYNISNRNSTATIRRFAEVMADATGTRIVNDFPTELEKTGFTRITHAVINPSKLEGLGWHAQYSLEESLRETISICKKN